MKLKAMDSAKRTFCPTAVSVRVHVFVCMAGGA